MIKNIKYINSICSIFFFILISLLVSNAFADVLDSESGGGKAKFDHFDTAFPLTGMHIDVACGECHMDGIFKGTPQQCFVCHNGVRATGKSPGHVPSDDNCDNCHTTFSMNDARFEHFNITAACTSCHNGVTSNGLPSNHILTNQECNACHNTNTWLNALFDHAEVTGPCSSCHNGIVATGKTQGHVVTALECDACHSTNTWLGAVFDHSTITTVCSSCHNGTVATGKAADHVPTMQECDACHSTNTWLGASFDHSMITDVCSSCHNDVIAAGKALDHPVTSNSCELCHVTTDWSINIFVHSSISDHNPSVDCIDCHIGNNFAVSPYTFPSHIPDCAACHQDDFIADSHKKTEQPVTVLYDVNALKDCTGSCHLYTNDNFDAVLEFRVGEHSINDTQF